MTENKENQNEAEVKLEAESKVTTGAWWKSALNLLPGKKKEAATKQALYLVKTLERNFILW